MGGSNQLHEEAVYQQDSNELKVYPNPFSENVTFLVLSKDECTKIEVFDMSGHLVYSTTTASEDHDITINTSAWNPGVYVARYGSYTEKIVKR